MAKVYTIQLHEIDLGQVLDGLEIRAQSWERTAEYLRTQSLPADEMFIIEECSKREEADRIAKHYRLIIHEIHRQMRTQQ